MGLRKAKGNTYSDVDWLWSPLVGGCGHQCNYCYAMKNCLRFGKEWALLPHWASEGFKGSGDTRIWKGFPFLPEGKIFVCDTTDLFAENVLSVWIENILEWCWFINAHYGDIQQNQFIFCTKNPERYFEFNYIFERFLNGQISFGITLETNRDTRSWSHAPIPEERARSFAKFISEGQYCSFVSIEPIMDFDQSELLDMIEHIKPEKVYIGADSKKCNLPEPSIEKIAELDKSLRAFTEVRIKSNLKRLIETPEQSARRVGVWHRNKRR